MGALGMAKRIEEEEQVKLRIVTFGSAGYTTDFQLKVDPTLGQIVGSTKNKRTFYGTFNAAHAINEMLDPKITASSVIPLSNDSIQPLISKYLEQLGLQTHGISITGSYTPSQTVFYDQNGKLIIGALDGDLYNRITVKNLESQIPNIIKDAQAVIIDSILPEEVQVYLAWLCAQAQADIYVIISSLASVKNIMPLLPKSKFIFGSKKAIDQLAFIFNNQDPWQSIEALGKQGRDIFAFDDKGMYALINQERIYMPKYSSEEIVNVSGEELIAAGIIIYSLAAGKPPKEALRCALAAAALYRMGKEWKPNNIAEFLRKEELKRNSIKKQIENIIITNKPVLTY